MTPIIHGTNRHARGFTKIICVVGIVTKGGGMEFDLKREIRAYGRQTDLARKLNLSKAFVSAVYTGKKQPTDALLKELGWERETITRYRRVKK
jgi:transcriptional regulator with XRE-family HTH domain